MKDYFVINKKEGQTPLEALEAFRRKEKIGKDVPMTYAGRLDPLVSGLMIILAGYECKQKDKYLKLDKEYDFTVLFGFATDTYDILGEVKNSTILTNSRIDLEKQIKNNLKFFKGKFRQKYPMYSSKTVDGKQLHEYARGGEEVKIPEHEVQVKSLKYIRMRKIDSEKLLNNIEKRIAKVRGDFRQKEILKLWRQKLKKDKSHKNMRSHYFIASFCIRVSSGTYVRAIANDLGEKIGIPSLAFSIKRTKIGRYAKII